jgi:hypothetical protein
MRDPIATIPTDDLERMTTRAYWRSVRSWREAVAAQAHDYADMAVKSARSDDDYYHHLRAELDARKAARDA